MRAVKVVNKAAVDPAKAGANTAGVGVDLSNADPHPNAPRP